MERRPDSILYIETDIPPQMTCTDWRRSHREQARRWRLFSRLRARRAAAASAPRTP